MTGPATALHEALRDIALEADIEEARRAASVAAQDITIEQLAAMDVAAEVLAMDDGRPLLPRQALLLSALKVEMGRRKDGGA